MGQFRFEGVDSYGEPVGGTVAGADAAGAGATLAARGWTIHALDPVAAPRSAAPSAPVPRANPLKPREVTDLLDQIRLLVGANVPLPSGLRAAATELESAALRATFERLADRVEAGIGLEAALLDESTRFPAQVRGLVAAGVRTGTLAEVLGQLVRSGNLGQELRRRAALTLAYPTLVFVALVVLIGFICRVSFVLNEGWNEGLISVRRFGRGNAAPDFARALIDLTRFVAEHDVALGLGLAAAYLVGFLAWRFALSPARRRGIVESLPLVGPLVQAAGLAEFCQLAAILVDAALPLPEALELAGASVRDPALAASSRHLAERVAAGEPFGPALRTWADLPAGLGQILAWGEDQADLAGSLRFAGEMFEARAVAQGRLTALVLAGILLVLIFWMVCFAVASVYLPLRGALEVLS